MPFNYMHKLFILNVKEHQTIMITVTNTFICNSKSVCTTSNSAKQKTKFKIETKRNLLTITRITISKEFKIQLFL